ncbi:hypothetical protein LGK95_08095 [Clostridium algoriphilum]|uniref:hypothetical protein n=1 Tax=Clostridium algoriphilum TaxID=198347 RepID=UPI001CF55017|nr:hypothetical protein [Clostridium algoriphilum]MCB2293480.1 hypothetical protein [Clostridium algoriphilum]
MFTIKDIRNTKNADETDPLHSQSDWFVIIHYFESFLEKQYKRRYTIDGYLNDVKQYIDWYFSNNIDKCFILNKEDFNKYEFYLRCIKNYKESTITYKKVALRKVDKFLMEFNKQNGNDELLNHPRTNRNQYNYLTESYIKL